MQPGLRWGVLALVCSFLSLSAKAEPFYNGTWSICGKNDMDKMIDRDAAMQAMGNPIGIYRSSQGSCTGTLIDKDLFITSAHCEDACADVSVTFGFMEAEETFKCKEIVEKGPTDETKSDFMVIRLEGNPGVSHGWYKLSDQELQPKQPLLIIHHPMGTPMKVSQKDCFFVEEKDGMLRHRCDTEPGSSGSAILVPDYTHPENTRIVGIHGYGGCTTSTTSSTTTNSGPSVRHISSVSPFLRALVR